MHVPSGSASLGWDLRFCISNQASSPTPRLVDHTLDTKTVGPGDDMNFILRAREAPADF